MKKSGDCILIAQIVKFFTMLLVFSSVSEFTTAQSNNKPNVVIIMADDLGFNDVSFHGSSEIPTPNIDALAFNGVILNRFYTPPLCTPSRSSFMTGKYPTKLGMQHFVIVADEPWGLPLNEKVMPEYFRDAGYRTALVGKWHLGFYQKAYTPTMRGFDSHFGYLGPYIGYYDYTHMMHNRNFSRGYDMRQNLSVNYEINPKPYVTDLFTSEAVNLISSHDSQKPLFLVVNHLAPHTGNESPDKPLEAPEEEIKKFEYIQDPDRRTLAAMISVLDKSVGEIVAAIKDKGMMNNTIIMFYSDNGGPTIGIHSTKASNFPLRGQKESVWEGGCRVAAAIYSPLIKSSQRVSNEFMHVTDILPTLAAAANITINNPTLDGINQWPMISKGEPTARKEILYNIENVSGYSAVVNDGWKLVNGTDDMQYATWLGTSGVENVNISFESYVSRLLNSKVAKNLPELSIESIKKLRDEATVKCSPNSKATACNPLISPCLFNILEDPCEQNNLADSNPAKTVFLLARLDKHLKDMLPSRRRYTDVACDPINFNNTWTWWQEDENPRRSPELIIIIAVGVLVVVALMCLLFAKLNNRTGKLKIMTKK